MKAITLQKQFVLLFFILLSSFILHAQNVAINNTGAPANPAAMLDVNSTSSGFLPPRMTTTQMNAIATPPDGLQVFNSTTKCLMLYVNGSWQVIYCACVTAPVSPIVINGNSSPCLGSSGNAYSIAGVVGAASYTWSVPTGDTITSGQGTPYITVSFPGITFIRNDGTSGEITVTASNACGTSAPQAIGLNVDTSAASTFTSLPSSPVTNSPLFFYPLNEESGQTYSWAFQNGNPSSSTSETSSVTWSTAGTYTTSLTITSGSGCSTTTNSSINITTANPLPCPHGTVTFNTIGIGAHGVIQSFTVPCSATTITITAYGAQGGSYSGYTGGKGAEMKASFTVTSGEVIKILVGQQGLSDPNAGGGGGGTFVATNSNTPLIVAGGGSGYDGSWGGNGYQNGVPGLTGTSGGNGCSSSGGSGGNGGGATNGSSGGGGFSGNGVASSCTSNTSGLSFLNGGTGGTNCANGQSDGGFGGGAADDPCCQGAGGAGGGYSGGGGSTNCSNGTAGAGGSFIASGASIITTASGVQTGNGQVIITY